MSKISDIISNDEAAMALVSSLVTTIVGALAASEAARITLDGKLESADLKEVRLAQIEAQVAIASISSKSLDSYTKAMLESARYRSASREARVEDVPMTAILQPPNVVAEAK